MDNNNPRNKARRLAFVLSGTLDAIIGGVLLLFGFGWLPLDVREYGFQPWHAILVGAILFFTGMWFVAHNLSRLEE